MLLPVLVYIQDGGLNGTQGADANPIVRATSDVIGFFGFEVSFTLLLIVAAIPLLLRQLFLYAKNVLSARAEHSLEADLRIRQLWPLLRADIPFYIRNNQGEVISTFMFDVTNARKIVRAMIEVLGDCCLLLIYGALAFVVAPTLAVIAFPLFALSWFIAKSQDKNFKDRGIELSKESQGFGRKVTESFQAIRLVKMRGAEEQVGEDLEHMTRRLSTFQFNLQRIQAAIDAVVQPMLLFGVLGVIYVAFEFLDMRLAEIGFFLFLVHRAVPAVVAVNANRLLVASATGSLNRIEELRSDAEKAAEVGSGRTVFENLKNQIQFCNVSFRYQAEGSTVEALKDVSFSIDRGELVALVGPSGAGKSTTVDLITRFYDPTDGEILFDGIASTRLNMRSLRRRIAFVTQEPVMFHESVRANICFGLEEQIPDERVWDCLRRSHCEEFMDLLPNGLDTVIGERGLRLSGGQRQRLALARALIQDPSILILDEPTSALDSVSEAEIHATLEELRGEVTMIVIAHRLATIQTADLILVLDRGQLVGQGTHATLQAKVGTYRQLVEMQQL